jgi:hypothetical protein
MKIYRDFGSVPIWDIRGKYIHKYNSADMPVYEIRGGFIHKAYSPSKATFDIRGHKIHEHMSEARPLYEPSAAYTLLRQDVWTVAVCA